MINHCHYLKRLILTALICLNINKLKCLVTEITGDTGDPQTGAIILSGGQSGANFSSDFQILTLNLNSISLPQTTSSTGQIMIQGSPVLHNSGNSSNIFIGAAAGNFSTNSQFSTGLGNMALNSLIDGNSNTSIGFWSLTLLTTGSSNTSIGPYAGTNLISGSNNVLMGVGAGINYINDESQNIIIGNNFCPVGENKTIRIGDGTQHDCYIDGIYGSTINPETCSAMTIDKNGKLAAILSSKKFKKNISHKIKKSKQISNLRSVSFNFKKDKNKKKQFGLIAEEVYRVFPDLTILKDNKPYAVLYNSLNSLLLNELKKQKTKIKKLNNKISNLYKQIQIIKTKINPNANQSS